VKDPRVIAAMKELRRADFLPPELRRSEYADRPLAIGHGQTTSQPSLIALMVQELRVGPEARVLEVGTGSGYQTALLAKLVKDVYSIDIVEPLALAASARLAQLGYANAHVKAGDGYLGWPEAAPFDGIVVCAAAPRVPQPLLDQLKPGGRLVIPVGEGDEARLAIYEKQADGGVKDVGGLAVRFVPFTGEHADRDRLDAGR